MIEAYIAFGADRNVVTALLNAVHEQSRQDREQHVRSARGSSTRLPPQQVGSDTDPDEVRGHYTVEQYDTDFELDASGVIRRITCTVGIRAVRPGVRFYYTSHASGANRRSSHPGIETITGATLDRINPSALGASAVYLRLHRDLDPNEPEPYLLTYRIDRDDDQGADDEIAYLARPGCRRHTLTVRFTPPMTPATIWRIESPDSHTAAMVGPHNQLAPRPDNAYSWQFDHLAPGWSYGMIWRWPDPVK